LHNFLRFQETLTIFSGNFQETRGEKHVAKPQAICLYTTDKNMGDAMPSEIFPSDPEHPGPHLAARRASAGLTLAALSARTGVAHQSISRIENRCLGISPSVAFRLAAFFGDPPFYWAHLQRDYDLALAYRAALPVLEGIRANRQAA
jgi:addiction module HigA family antidote